MSERSRLRTVLFSIITIGISTVFSIVLLEYGFSHYFYSNMHKVVNKEFDPVLGWRYIPGTYSMKPSNSLMPHNIYINKFGLRGKDVSRPQRNGVNRIVVLGDSMSFGVSFNQKDIYTTQLENALNERLPDSYEIINAGVEGYGTTQQLLLMKNLIKEDVVGDIYILQVFTNDILDILQLRYGSLSIDHRKPGYILNNEGKLVLKNPPKKKEKRNIPKHKNKNNLMTLQVAQTLLEQFLQSRPDLLHFVTGLGVHVKVPRMPGLINGWYNDEVVKKGIPLMKELIREIKSETYKQDAKLLVMFIPSAFMVYPDTYGPLLKATFPDAPQIDEFQRDIEKPQRAIRQICEELDIPLLDLFPVLQRNNSKALYIPRDGHLTKDGHSVVANALSGSIQNMLPY